MSTSRLKDIPGVPTRLDDTTAIRNLLLSLREHVRRINGYDGSEPLAASGGGGGSTTIVIPGAPPPPAPAPGPYVPDLTPPPTPTGVTVDAGPTFIFITTDPPTFTQGHGYARTMVYAVPWELSDPTPPTFADAVLQHEFVGEVGSFDSDFNTRWCVWVKWKTVDGVESVSPAGGTNGFQATTGQDVVRLLEILTGEITESQLYTALGDRIDLIDGPSSLAGSVAARILAEANARGAAISNEASLRISGDASLASQITTLTAAAPVNAEFTSWRYYGFDSDTDGWTAAGGTLSQSGGIATWTPSTGNAYISRSLPIGDGRFSGTTYTHVRAKVRRVSGGSGTWEGSCLYSTASHGYNFSYLKTIAEPATPDTGWTVLEWDMRDLTLGGADWVSNEITGVRLDIVTGAGTAWELDWIAIGSASTSPTLAALQTEQSVRADADSAEALARETLAVQLRGTYAGTNIDSVTSGLVFSERTARVTADSAQVSSINTINARLTAGGDIADAIVSVTATANAAAADADDALTSASATAAQLTTVQSRIGSETGMAVAHSWDFTTTTDGWTAGSATVVWAAGNITWAPTAANASLSRALSVAERFDGADYTLVRARVKRLSGTSAWEGTLYYSTATHGSSNLYRKTIAAPAVLDEWNIVEWDMAALSAGGTDWIDNEIRSLRVDLVGDATSTWLIDWIAYGAKTGTPMSAVVQQEISTRASETGHLGATYSVRINLTQDGRTVAGGFGITGTSGGTAGPTIDFGVRADKFWIGAPSGSTGVGDILPFIVVTSATTLNGVSVPVGVYMDAAYIRNGDIVTAKIGNAQITDAKIVSLSATKITAGTISVGNYIQSSNYVANTAGWRISGDGGFEIRNAANTRVLHLGASGAAPVLRVGTAIEILANGTATFAGTVNASAGSFTGNVYAATGTIGGTIIDANGIKSSNYVGGASGWRLHNDGTAEFDAATVRGNVTADSLNAASGTIGTVTAGLLRNASSTTQINLNATGSQNFISAGSGAVRITADGDAYFTKVAASGTWNGNLQLIQNNGGVLSNNEVVMYLDTGLSVGYYAIVERSMSARVVPITIYKTPSAGPAGTYMGDVYATASAMLVTPFFETGAPPAANPYGTGLARVYLRIVFKSSVMANSFELQRFEWTLDYIG